MTYEIGFWIVFVCCNILYFITRKESRMIDELLEINRGLVQALKEKASEQRTEAGGAR